MTIISSSQWINVFFKLPAFLQTTSFELLRARFIRLSSVAVKVEPVVLASGRNCLLIIKTINVNE